MDFCEGFYKNTTKAISMNVTSCSKPKGMYSFDPTAILQKELKKGVTLQDIKWPSQVQDGLRALSTAARAMFVLYMIGIATVGLMILTSLAGLSGSRLLSIVNFSLGNVSSPSQQPFPREHHLSVPPPGSSPS
jgi:SUR7/PalI family